MSWGTFVDESRPSEVVLVIGFDGTGTLHFCGKEVAECRCWPFPGYPPKPEIGDTVYDPRADVASVYVSTDARDPIWHRLVAVAHTCGATRETGGVVEVYTSGGRWVKARKTGHFWEPEEGDPSGGEHAAVAPTEAGR